MAAKSQQQEEAIRVWRRLRAWFHLRAGRLLLEQEKAQLDVILPDLFGYYLLQVGSPGRSDLVSASRVRHRVVMSLEPPSSGKWSGVPHLYGEADALPFATESLDVVLLPHVLEFTPEPHQVLREVDRVLVPEGHLVVVAFNPWSLWTLWRWLGWRHRNPPWSGSFHSSARLQDWLRLLGFDTMLARSFVYYPPVRHGAFLRHFRVFEYLGERFEPFLGAVYILVAKKRVTTLTPIAPRWRLGRKLLPNGVPEPTVRGRTE